MHDPGKGIAHGVAGQHCRPGRIHAVHQIVEHSVVVQHISRVFRGDRNLIGQSPGHNAGMIVVLYDQFLHLADGIFPAVRHMLGNVGNLGPDNHPGLVAQIVKILIVLIVGETDSVGSDLLDHLHIPVVILLRDGVADALEVLMPGHAVEGIGFSVQEKSLFRVHRKSPHPKTAGDLVHRFAIHQKLRSGLIEIGILPSVPQMHAGNRKHRLAFRAFRLRHAPAVGVKNCDLYRSLRAVLVRLDSYLRVGALHLRRDPQSRRSEIVQGKVMPVYHNEIHIPVNTAVESKVCLLRIHPVVDGIVHRHGQCVLLLQHIPDLHPKSRVPAVVLSHASAVDFHPRGGVDAAKLQIHGLPLPVKFRHGKSAGIASCPAIVIIAAILSIQGIPGMGQIYRLLSAIGQLKLPVVIDTSDFSHALLAFCHFLQSDLSVSYIFRQKFTTTFSKVVVFSS